MTTSLLAPIVSTRPVVRPAAGRGTDLHLRVTAPATGDALPVVVLSHGYGCSFDDYGPLVDAWAGAGFAVIQPTHLDSRTLGLTPEDPRFDEIWRIRIADLTQVLDDLAAIEAAVPGLAGRLDHDRIAVAGHSWGGQTASTLLGARVLDADGRPGEDFSDARIVAGVLLSTTGTGGDDLSAFAAEHFPFMSPSFDAMTTPALVVAGDHDQSPLTTRGPDWFVDPYLLGPGEKTLLTVFGGEHSLGGIPGLGLAEVTDPDPERVAFVAAVTTAFLQQALGAGGEPWAAISADLGGGGDARGRLESKGRAD